MEKIYNNLQPSGLHRFLVSDLLLRYPDPGTLGRILELDTKAPIESRLPSNLVVAIYGHLRNAIDRRRLPRLSRRINLSVTKALEEEGETGTLISVYQDLSRTTVWEPEGVWVLLDIILRLVRQGATDNALRLLQGLLADNHIPRSAVGKSNLKHPEAITILIQSIILRCCLQWKLYGRAQQIVVEDLLNTISNSEPSLPVFDLLLQACRGAIASLNKEHVEWAGGLLLSLAQLDGHPPVPNSILNTYYAAVSPDIGLDLYLKLPQPHPETVQSSPYLPSPGHLVRFAKAATINTILTRILPDVDRTLQTDFIAHRQSLLRNITNPKLAMKSRRYLNKWCLGDAFTPDSFKSLVDGPLLIRLLPSFLTTGNISFATHLLETYDSTWTSIEDRLYLIPANLINDNLQQARQLLIDLSPSPEILSKLITSVAESSLLPALATIALANEINASSPIPTPASVIIKAASQGKWDIIKNLPVSMTEDEKTELKIMKRVRFGRFTRPLKLLTSILEKQESTISLSTIRFILNEACMRRRWIIGLSFWKLALDRRSQIIGWASDDLWNDNDNGDGEREQEILKLGWEYLEKLRKVLLKASPSEVPQLVDMFAEVRMEVEAIMEGFQSPSHRATTRKLLQGFEDTVKRLRT